MFNILVSLIFFSWFCLAASTTQAGAYVPESLWESSVISEAVLSVAVGDLSEDGRNNLIVLDEKKIRIYSDLNLSSASITLAASHPETFHRVWLTNADGLPGLEIFVAGFKKTQVFTKIYKFSGMELEFWQSFTGKLVIPWCDIQNQSLQPDLTEQKTEQNSNCQILAQNQKGRGNWAEDVVELKWQDGHFQEEPWQKFKKGIGSQPVSLFDVARLSGHMVASLPNGILEVFSQNKSVWKSGMKYGGAMDVLIYESRDPMGIIREDHFGIPVRLVPRVLVQKILPSPKPIPDLPKKKTKTTEESPEPVFVLKGLEVVTVRNDGFLEGVIGKFPRMKSAEIVQLEWTGKVLHEKNISRKLDGAISDLAIFDHDGDGLKNEALIVLWVRQGGVFETMRPKKSVLAVVKLK